MELTRGQKVKISQLTAETTLDVVVELQPPSGDTIDVSCFGVNADSQLSDDRYMVFYNQTVSPSGEISFSNSGTRTTFRVKLAALPQSVRKLVFVGTIDGRGTMAQAGRGLLQILAGGNVVASYAFEGSDFTTEKAVMVGEVYFKDEWRLAAVGQGFAGGLSAVLKHFGGKETEEPAPQPKPSAAPTPSPASPPPPAPKLSLTKITLEKRGQAQPISLKKTGGGDQIIHVNLNWIDRNAGKPSGFLGLGRAKPADLDLGCMFEMNTGLKGVIQPLGGIFGSKHQEPYIFLDKDDRTGAASDGENMYIYRPDLIKRVLVFALIYEGAANFSTVDGTLKLKDLEGNEITIPLNSPDPSKPFCAVALIQKDGDKVTITKEERYFAGHPYCDQFYGFGFRWQSGSK